MSNNNNNFLSYNFVETQRLYTIFNKLQLYYKLFKWRKTGKLTDKLETTINV